MSIRKNYTRLRVLNSINSAIITILRNSEVTSLLVENGADLNVQNNDGFSPLFVAAKEGNLISNTLIDFY